MKTYRELLSELQKLSDAQLDSPISVITCTDRHEEDCERDPDYNVIPEELNLHISANGLIYCGNGLMDDYLGAMEEPDLVVSVGAPYFILGYDGIPSNEKYQ